MFERILVFDIFVALLLPVAWGIAGYLAGRLAFRPTRGRLLVSVRITLAVLGLAGLLVVAKIVMIQQFWSYDWLFAHDRAIVSLPLVILPAAATLVWSVPRLWRIVRGALTERRAKVDAAIREAASAPGLVVPHPVNGARRNPRRIRHALPFGSGGAAPEPHPRRDLHRRYSRTVGSPAAPLPSDGPTRR
jgi:hypothetical protein